MTDVQDKSAQAMIELAESEKMQKLAQSIQTNYLSPTVWSQMVGMSKTLFESHALPKHLVNTAQVVMVLQAGYEMGMKPIESLQSLYIVNGAINIWGKATPRRLREHGYNIKYVNETDETCTAVVTGSGREKYEETFTFEMAKQSGWTGSPALKTGWLAGANRRRKLRYAALSMIIHTYIPHVLGAADEIQEIAEDSMPPVVPATTLPANATVEEGAVIEKRDDLTTFIERKKREDEAKVIKKSKSAIKPAEKTERIVEAVTEPIETATPDVKES